MSDNGADRSPRTCPQYLNRRTALSRLTAIGAGAALATAALVAFPAAVRGSSDVAVGP